MTSVPPLRPDSLSEPPPWYSGDNPTVPNPVYRGPGGSTGAAGTGKPEPAAGTAGGAKVPAESGTPREEPAKKDDVGRRGNLVMGAMLVMGMVVVGAAFAMVSAGPGGDDGTEAAAGGDEAQALTASTPGDHGSDDGAAGGDSGAAPAGTPDATVPEPVAFGETVRVLDGVAVTAGDPRPFDPVVVPDAPASEYLAVEVTVVNGAAEEVRMLPVVHLVDDLDEIGPYLDGAELTPTGHPQVVDESSGLSETWSGADMELGSTAFGAFGFGVLPPSDGSAGPYLVVWVEGDGGARVPVAFGPA